MIMEAGKSKICRVGLQAVDPGRDHIVVQVWRPSAGRISSCPPPPPMLPHYWDEAQLLSGGPGPTGCRTWGSCPCLLKQWTWRGAQRPPPWSGRYALWGETRDNGEEAFLPRGLSTDPCWYAPNPSSPPPSVFLILRAPAHMDLPMACQPPRPGL